MRVLFSSFALLEGVGQKGYGMLHSQNLPLQARSPNVRSLKLDWSLSSSSPSFYSKLMLWSCVTCSASPYGSPGRQELCTAQTLSGTYQE